MRTAAYTVSRTDPHPAYWNRCVRALVAAGEDAPDEVKEHNRRLDKRGKHIADWKKAHGED